MKTYQVIARTLGARLRCDAKPDTHSEWSARHQAYLDELLSGFPHGSGFDLGTKLDDTSTPERLVFNTAFHHVNESGMYDGWTEHQVIVKPSLEMGYRMRITGRDRNGIKELIADYFAHDLDADVSEFASV